jgi:hypothetical protein
MSVYQDHQRGADVAVATLPSDIVRRRVQVPVTRGCERETRTRGEDRDHALTVL